MYLFFLSQMKTLITHRCSQLLVKYDMLTAVTKMNHNSPVAASVLFIYIIIYDYVKIDYCLFTKQPAGNKKRVGHYNFNSFFIAFPRQKGTCHQASVLLWRRP